MRSSHRLLTFSAWEILKGPLIVFSLASLLGPGGQSRSEEETRMDIAGDTP